MITQEEHNWLKALVNKDKISEPEFDKARDLIARSQYVSVETHRSNLLAGVADLYWDAR